MDAPLDEEIKKGRIAEVPGGMAALKHQCSSCAVGKLGLVQLPGRSPRLVVDSSVSVVTEKIVLPNRSCNPTLSHLSRCLPVGGYQEEMSALVLGVAKAHRRIKIQPKDEGLLCFHDRGCIGGPIFFDFFF